MAGRMSKRRHDQEHHFVLSRGLLLRMLASCAIVTLLPLLLCNLMYHSQIQKTIAQEEQNVAKYLSDRKARYDVGIHELDKVLLSVMGDSDLLSVSIMENPLTNSRSHLYTILKAQKQISLIAKPYDYLDTLILLNMQGDFALSSHAIYLRMDLFSAAMEKRYPGYQWPEEITASLRRQGQPRQQWLYLPSRTDNGAIAVYMQTLFMANGNHTILSVMTPGKMDSYLHPDDEMDMMIYNEANQRLSGSLSVPLTDAQLLAVEGTGMVTDAQGKRYLVQMTTSDISGHRLYAVMPYARIEGSIASMQTINGFYFLVVLLCTLVLCALVTWINMKPLDDMLRFLFGSDGINLRRTIGWKNIDARIHEILRRNDELSNSLENQREGLLNLLLYELISNGNANTNRTIKRIERLNLPIEDDYCVLLMEVPRVTSSMEPTAFSLLMHKYISYHFSQVLVTLDMTTRRYVILIKTGEAFEALSRRFALLQKDVFDALQVQPQGCCFWIQSLREIEQHYWNAVMMLEMHREEGNELMMLDGELECDRELVFPPRLEQEIQTAIITGNREMLETALNELYDTNNQDRLMSAVSARLLWERVSSAVAAALTRAKNIPDMLQLKTILSLRNPGEMESRYDFVHRIAAALDSVFILTQRETGVNLRRSELGKRIVDYIQLHLSEPNLCLQMVADHFSLSSAYISSLVKDETGQSFSVYCERLRIANACELLREGRQIQNVAEAVGYSSAHTFRRVFKKVVGILPSEYAN